MAQIGVGKESITLTKGVEVHLLISCIMFIAHIVILITMIITQIMRSLAPKDGSKMYLIKKKKVHFQT